MKELTVCFRPKAGSKMAATLLLFSQLVLLFSLWVRWRKLTWMWRRVISGRAVVRIDIPHELLIGALNLVNLYAMHFAVSVCANVSGNSAVIANDKGSAARLIALDLPHPAGET